jgi:hypothetical protein
MFWHGCGIGFSGCMFIGDWFPIHHALLGNLVIASIVGEVVWGPLGVSLLGEGDLTNFILFMGTILDGEPHVE